MDTGGRNGRNHKTYFTATSVILIVAVLGLTILRIESIAPAVPTKYAHLTLSVLPPSYQPVGDSQHAVFAPTNFTVHQGQIVNVTILNYDQSPDSFNSPGLGVTFVFTPASAEGIPSVSHFQFTARTNGTFSFWCGFCHTATGQYAWMGHSLTPGQPDLLKGTLTVLN